MKDLEMIYREIQPKIYAFFYVKTSNLAVAEDLTHDVFYEAYKGIHSFSGYSSFTLLPRIFLKNTTVLKDTI